MKGSGGILCPLSEINQTILGESLIDAETRQHRDHIWTISDLKIRAGLSNRQCCSAPGGVCVQRIWARITSTFGSNLIERLRTRLVDVQTQNQFREGSKTTLTKVEQGLKAKGK